MVDPDQGSKIIELNINSFVNHEGNAELWADFTLTAGGDSYHGEGEATLDISSPAFMFIAHNSGQPVDFDVRYIRNGTVKLAWYLPPPRQSLAGDHDINGDGTIDVSATYLEGLWVFTFSDALEGVTQMTDMGHQELTANEDGTYTGNVEESMGWGEFTLTFSDKQMNIFTDLRGNGEGNLEWWEVHGGHGGLATVSTAQLLWRSSS